MKTIINGFILVLFSMFFFTSCGVGGPETLKIRSRTDPMAERILKALDMNNYNEFSDSFNNSLKSEYNYEKFHDLHLFMKKNQGEYISKTFFSIIRDKNSITVQYAVVYKVKNPEYILSLSYNNADGTGPVSGINLLPFNVSR